MKKEFVLISIGSNLGKRIENILQAINLLKEKKVLENIKTSSFYETEPVGYKNQPNYINIAITGETQLSPKELLLKCKEIEKLVGRVSRPKWHAREIDIDILLYGGNIINTTELQIPHPEMCKRKFVLIPANEIASNWIVPSFNKTIAEILEICQDSSRVDIFNSN